MLVAARVAAYAPPDERDVALLQRAVDLLERSDLRSGADEAHWIAYCLVLHERDEEARALSDVALAENRRTGDVWTLCFGLYARSALERATGRVDVAHSYALEAVALAEEIGERWRLSQALGLLAEAEAARGRVERCREALTARRRVVGEELFERDRAWDWALPHGVALVAGGRLEEAIPELEAALRVAKDADAVSLRSWHHLVPLELAEAYALAGRRREAEALLRAEGASIERCWLVRPRARLARVRGLLASEAQIDRAFAEARALLQMRPHLLEEARIELC